MCHDGDVRGGWCHDGIIDVCAWWRGGWAGVQFTMDRVYALFIFYGVCACVSVYYIFWGYVYMCTMYFVHYGTSSDKFEFALQQWTK